MLPFQGQMWKGFTLIEIIVTLAIIGILSTITLLIINPPSVVKKTQYTRAIEELKEIGKAVQLYASDHGSFPADVSRGLPSGIEKYLTPDESWPNGPIPGTVYDYDNWLNKSCIDPEGSGSIQISLRQIPGRNPDGSNVWAWYVPLVGNGTPHCDSNTEWNKGECVSCPGFDF